MSSPYAALPSVGVLLQDPRLAALPHDLALRVAREAVAQAREAVGQGSEIPVDLAELAHERALALRQPHLRRVLNATGVVVHTNLGRAPLSPEARAAVDAVAQGYSNLEMELESGKRGGRLTGVRGLVQSITGAEDALVVNNNAAAVLLCLTALARDGEVVVSRGELVEIGGSFRVPDVITAGGARLVEVGTTNRTRAADYAAALSPETRLLLRVHPSNFRIQGFTERPDRRALAALATQAGVPLLEDLGGGLLRPEPADPGEEESVEAVLAEGVDLVCFSGDKLLGGPQAGLIAGRAELVERLRRHPMYRALRVDKLVLAALEATLRMVDEGRAGEIPVRRMLQMDPILIRRVAERIARAIPGAVVEEDVGFSGGGALPGEGLPTAVVAIRVSSPEALSAVLRARPLPVVARVARQALLLDPRTLGPGEEALLIEALNAALAARGSHG